MSVGAELIRQVPYSSFSGDSLIANQVLVETPEIELPLSERCALYHLSRATRPFGVVSAVQRSGPSVLAFLPKSIALEKTATDPSLRDALGDYHELFSMMRAPYNHAGVVMRHPAPEALPSGPVQRLLLGIDEASPGRGLYPRTISRTAADELDGVVNSTVMRIKSGFTSMPNELRFNNQLAEAIHHLRLAGRSSKNQSLQDYAAKTIAYLHSGSPETYDAMWAARMANISPIDFFMTSAEETYLDGLLGVRGEAEAFVGITNSSFDVFAEKICSMAGELDAAAPWQHKREAPTSMDRMRFIDVIAWSGGFDCFPSVTFANMLPNNQGVVERLGGMQTMFTNIEAAKAFNPAFAFVYDTLISPEARRVADRMPTNAVYQNVLHELGHSLGAKPQRKESEAFGGHAMTLEETRAELFSLWSAAELLKRGMIVRDDLIAMQYDMLFSLIRSMPNGLFGHSGARNIMFNNFLEHGAIHKVDGKYTVDSDVMTAAATSLLATVADMRAIGDSRAFEELKENYLRQECVEEFRELLGTANGGWSVLFREIQNPGCTSFRTPRSSRDEARSLERLLLL